MRLGARAAERAATLLAFLAEPGMATLQFLERLVGAGQFRAGTRELLVGGGALALDLGGILKQPLAALARSFRAAAASLERRHQVRVRAMRQLHPGAGLIARAFGGRQLFAGGGERGFRASHGVGSSAGTGAQHLQAVLALEHASALVGATADAQPLAPHPFPRR